MKELLILCYLFTTDLWAQDSASVKVIARSLPDKILLRWAVDQPLAWKNANAVGFWIERATISRNGEAIVPMEKKQLVTQPLKPKPLEAWKTMVLKDQNAAILAQALFGDTFKVSPPGNQIANVFAISNELEQRFTLALVAAEQNYEASKLAGWALEDHSVLAGEKYIYSVSVAIPEKNNTPVKNGTVYASPDLYEALPQPIDLAGVFTDQKVTLSWNFNILQHIYTNYNVEKSKDNISFTPVNGVPIFNAQGPTETSEISMFYMDSIPNHTNFYYRIIGKTAFGETGPNSEVIQGKAEAALGFTPRIYQKELPTDNKVILGWEFDDKGNALIDKFQLRKSNTTKGPYKTVIDDIPATVREITFEGLGRVNYFTITAIGKNGAESESYPSLVQPVDSIPPTAPVGLHGIVDTFGIVRINWQKNLETDLNGYRIYRSHNPKAEFSEVTQTSIDHENYTDTLEIANLNRKIYYKILAEDQRYNRSGFSKVLAIDKPDSTPPSSPVINNYEVTANGIKIYWTSSSSPDIASHTIYRKTGKEQEIHWEKVFESKTLKDSIFFDTTLSEPNILSYTVVAKDSVGLESLPAKPINAVWNGQTIKEEDIKFFGTVNRELRFINLSWKVMDFYVAEYRLYKGTEGKGLKLYKTLNGTFKGYNDMDLEINSNYIYGLQVILNGGSASIIKQINLTY